MQGDTGHATADVKGVYGHAFTSRWQQIAVEMEEHFLHPATGSQEKAKSWSGWPRFWAKNRRFWICCWQWQTSSTVRNMYFCLQTVRKTGQPQTVPNKNKPKAKKKLRNQLISELLWSC